MKSIFVSMIICGIALAGVRFGGRVGYYDGDDPRTGQSASSAVFGGQISIPLLSLAELEISGSYSGSESDITMQQYLVSYIEDEYGQNFEGDSLGLTAYLEDEWQWSPDSLQSELLNDYTATFHDIDLGATMKVKIPIGALPLRPYIGAGGGAHILFSDADVLLQVVNEETGGNVSIDPYDHVHPGIHGVLGVSFEPPMVPLSVFGEYKYTKPLSSEEDVSGINMFYAGVNLGF
ncbi:MAG: hypothetical protein GF388_10555 [Candidatus Aegiribacteria sp.]|nr:hypothetical protein [Candidatus Aegiribacteria sp.]MBD3295462.1 hypothetical protein [Candidatus Fermentibacteria bacterium]